MMGKYANKANDLITRLDNLESVFDYDKLSELYQCNPKKYRIAYSNSLSGEDDFSLTNKDRDYIGIYYCYDKESRKYINDPYRYIWTLNKGRSDKIAE